MASRLVLAAAIAVLLGLLGWAGLRSWSNAVAPLSQNATRVAADVPIGSDTPIAVGPLELSGDALQVADLRLSHDYPSALQRLQARSLDSDLLRVTAHEEVRSACALVHRPDAASPRVDLDPNRRPWLDRLQRRCTGLSRASLQPLDADLPAAQNWRLQVPETVAAQQGREAAMRQSERLLRSSVDSRLLYAALRFQLMQSQLPLEQIFLGVRVPVQADIELALVNAADWIACARTHSCGSEGVWTLYTCAQFGCPPGIDLPTALRRLTPQWQFEISQAIAQWALQLR